MNIGTYFKNAARDLCARIRGFVSSDPVLAAKVGAPAVLGAAAVAYFAPIPAVFMAGAAFVASDLVAKKLTPTLTTEATAFALGIGASVGAVVGVTTGLGELVVGAGEGISPLVNFLGKPTIFWGVAETVLALAPFQFSKNLAKYGWDIPLQTGKKLFHFAGRATRGTLSTAGWVVNKSLWSARHPWVFGLATAAAVLQVPLGFNEFYKPQDPAATKVSRMADKFMDPVKLVGRIIVNSVDKENGKNGKVISSAWLDAFNDTANNVGALAKLTYDYVPFVQPGTELFSWGFYGVESIVDPLVQRVRAQFPSVPASSDWGEGKCPAALSPDASRICRDRNHINPAIAVLAELNPTWERVVAATLDVLAFPASAVFGAGRAIGFGAGALWGDNVQHAATHGDQGALEWGNSTHNVISEAVKFMDDPAGALPPAQPEPPKSLGPRKAKVKPAP